MGGHGEKLGRRRELAIAALLTEPSIPEAAKSVGVGRTTLTRWLGRSDFQDALREVRRRVLEVAVTKLQASTVGAVEVLEAGLSSDRELTRIKAATTILSHATRAAEVLDLADRIRRMEEFFAESDQ